VEPQLVEELQVEELELSEEFGEQVLRLVAEQALQPEVGQVLAEQALAELVLLGRH
jgi:(p)ppGpp synthase/HD superfamily hydrolase